MAKRLKPRLKCSSGHFIAIGKTNFCGSCRKKERYHIDLEFRKISIEASKRYKAAHRELINARARKRMQVLREQFQPSGFERWR